METARHIKVTVTCGINLKNPNITEVDEADPYVKINLGKNSSKSSISKCGKNPKWDHTWKAKYKMEPELKFSVFDKDTFTADDPMGSVTVQLNTIPKDGWRGNLILMEKGKCVGLIEVEIVWDDGSFIYRGDSGEGTPRSPTSRATAKRMSDSA